MTTAHAPIAHKTLCAAMADHRPPTSNNRVIVEKLLRQTPVGLTVDEIASRTGLPKESARSAMQRIRDTASTGRRDCNLEMTQVGRQYKYRMLPDAAEPKPVPKLIRHTPDGLTPHKLVTPDFAFDPTTFPWPHLAPPDRPEADVHKMHGSRRGDAVNDYAGPLPMCAGAGLGIYGPGQATKRSQPV